MGADRWQRAATSATVVEFGEAMYKQQHNDFVGGTVQSACDNMLLVTCARVVEN